MLKICFITDLHISEIGDYPLGINTRVNFEGVLDKVVSTKPNLIVLGGDLCHNTGDIEIYKWIKEKLDISGIFYNVIAGNHDNPKLLAEVFDSELRENETFFSLKIDKTKLVFLDSSAGKFSDIQYEWFSNELTSMSESAVIFMHHPPVLSNSKHMEPKYTFSEMDKFKNLCSKFQDLKINIFCGHYHVERSISLLNMNVFITPSTFIQVHPDFEDFKPIHDSIGYREIQIFDDNSVISSVVYL